MQERTWAGENNRKKTGEKDREGNQKLKVMKRQEEREWEREKDSRSERRQDREIKEIEEKEKITRNGQKKRKACARGNGGVKERE